MSFGNGIMEHTHAYRLWQRPFQEQKFAPVLRHNDLARVRRVIDVGCGPGTNARHFANAEYLGVDVNVSYIEFARRRYAGTFVVADITEWDMAGLEPYDFVFANSFFHHVSDDEALAILQKMADLVASGGFVHILDLVMPERRPTARLLARWDRGDFPRPLGPWRALLEEIFEPVLVEPYPLTAAGMTLWEFLYFKGIPRLSV